MIIIGAKGFAKEILQVVSVDMNIDDQDIVFFDNVSTDLPERIYNRFRILKSFEEVKFYLNEVKDKSFVLGLGNPLYRDKLYKQIIDIGGVPIVSVSKNAEIGSFDVEIGKGTSIMSGARISNSIALGKGCLIYYNTIITHDCKIGDFVEMAPNSIVLGRCKIGNHAMLGTGSIILPDVTIGNNVTVGAGTIVLKDVPDNCTIVGVPGKIISTK